jgi:hypothetical protein
VVKSVQSQGGLSPFDQHEFHVVDHGTSALITIYQTEQADLSADGIGSGLGWVTNCWFQEVSLATNKVLFEWSSLAHVSTSYSTIAPNFTDTSGTGLDPTEPWDYFHINSVDKDEYGDYLISARHTSTIYKISGTNGTILWRLSGTNGSTSFSLEPGLNFSYQHDARIRFQNSTTTILTLFDNAADGFHLQSAPSSAGLLIAIDHRMATATLLQRYLLTDSIVSSSQGNVQLLHPDRWQTSNVYIGWGENAYISEYTSDGTMVQQGHFATTGAMHYCSRKANVAIHPTDAPALYTYALDPNSSTQYYVSWNGATEVRGWRFYSASGSSSSDPKFEVLATAAKKGFETIYTANSYHQWSIVEALDARGKGLRNSSRVVETFVPGQALAAMCDESGCATATGYSSTPTVASVETQVMESSSSAAATAAATTSSGTAMGRTLGRRDVKGAAALGLAGT